MKRQFFMIAAVLAVSGCTTAQPDNIAYGKEVPMTPDTYASVSEVVKSKLKDPYSAVMGQVRARGRLRNGQEELVICGYVNAKNGFGGYNGQQIFIGVFNTPSRSFDLVAIGDQSPNAALHIQGSCRGAGIPM